MLKITVPAQELFDPQTSRFIDIPETKLSLEHSLVSVSKWEAHYCKPFLTKDKRTQDEFIYYIKCMTLTQNVNPLVYTGLTQKNINDIASYIEAPMTATTIKDRRGPRGRQVITSELIYSWMVSYNIPFECQKWHLNRLMMLIRVCSEQNNPQKMSKSELARQRTALNAQRRAKLNSRG